MKDTVIYRAYSKFVDTLSLGNVADERRYVVCIANAVIYSSLMCNTKDKLRIDKVYEYAKELASFLGLSLSFLYTSVPFHWGNYYISYLFSIFYIL